MHILHKCLSANDVFGPVAVPSSHLNVPTRVIHSMFKSNLKPIYVFTHGMTGCLANGRVTDPSRLYTRRPSAVASGFICDAPPVSVQENMNTVLRLFNPTGRGLNFAQLMAQLGRCTDCGRCFGVSLLRREDFVLHDCPKHRHGSPPLVLEEVNGVYVEEEVLYPTEPIAGPSASATGLTRSQHSHHSRYHPIYQDAAFTPIAHRTRAARRQGRILTPDFDLTREGSVEV